jgi:probable rRNA maturation factor
LSLDVEVIGSPPLAAGEIRRLAELVLASAEIEDGHLAVEFVDPERIAELNEEHRGNPEPTDVLSFPVDGAEDAPAGGREIGDVVICVEETEDVAEAVIHGVLHLTGMDHETDQGEMLALQAELLSWVRP